MNNDRHENDNQRPLSGPDANEGSGQEAVERAPHFPIPSSATHRLRFPISASQHALADIVRARENFMKPVTGLHHADGGGVRRPTFKDEITPETSQRYLHRCKILVMRYQRECDIHENRIDDGAGYFGALDVHAFAVWLLSLKPDVTSATWRFYRRTAYHVISGLPHDGVEAALSLLDNDRAHHETRAGHDGNDKRRRTLLRRAAYFDLDDFNLIQRSIQYQAVRSDTPLILRDWLIAGINVGLRPLEWRATSVEAVPNPATGQQMVWLFVMNPKTTNLRGNGLMRTLDISSLSDEAVGAVQRMSERGRAWNMRHAFDEEHAGVSKYLNVLSQTLFPRRSAHYSLYSCRHQFIANMDTIFSRAEVAAVAGWDLSGTQLVNAAARKTVWPSEMIARCPSPIAAEVATIQKIMNFNAERRQFKTRRR